MLHPEDTSCVFLSCGGMAEWLKAAVLKTADPQGSGSSNLSPSATSQIKSSGCTYKKVCTIISATIKQKSFLNFSLRRLKIIPGSLEGCCVFC